MNIQDRFRALKTPGNYFFSSFFFPGECDIFFSVLTEYMKVMYVRCELI